MVLHSQVEWPATKRAACDGTANYIEQAVDGIHPMI